VVGRPQWLWGGAGGRPPNLATRWRRRYGQGHRAGKERWGIGTVVGVDRRRAVARGVRRRRLAGWLGDGEEEEIWRADEEWRGRAGVEAGKRKAGTAHEGERARKGKAAAPHSGSSRASLTPVGVDFGRWLAGVNGSGFRARGAATRSARDHAARGVCGRWPGGDQVTRVPGGRGRDPRGGVGGEEPRARVCLVVSARLVRFNRVAYQRHVLRR
jgi:hypothetical protein